VELLDFATQIESEADPDLDHWIHETRSTVAKYVLRAALHSDTFTDVDRKSYQELVARSLADIPDSQPVVLSVVCRDAVLDLCDNGVRGAVLAKTTTNV
jgi:hypothetical protein